MTAADTPSLSAIEVKAIDQETCGQFTDVFLAPLLSGMYKTTSDTERQCW